jgi:hypothetical protein
MDSTLRWAPPSRVLIPSTSPALSVSSAVVGEVHYSAVFIRICVGNTRAASLGHSRVSRTRKEKNAGGLSNRPVPLHNHVVYLRVVWSPSVLPTPYLFHRAQADWIVLLIFSLRRILTSPTSSPVSIAHAREQLRVTRFDFAVQEMSKRISHYIASTPYRTFTSRRSWLSIISSGPG